MSDLQMGWKLNLDRTMNPEDLRVASAEIETFTQEMSHENPN
jgi:hypothetical protein